MERGREGGKWRKGGREQNGGREGKEDIRRKEGDEEEGVKCQ